MFAARWGSGLPSSIALGSDHSGWCGRDEQAIQGEPRVSFKGYVCLCVGRGTGQGMEQVWERGERFGEI